jgi:hypothetical protein
MKCGPAPHFRDSKPAPKSHNRVNTFISQQVTTSKRRKKQVRKKSAKHEQRMQRGGDAEFFVAGLKFSAKLIGKERPVVSDGIHGFEYAGDTFALGDVSARARWFGDIYHACAFVHGQKKNAYTWQELMNFPRGAEAVENGHGDIQDYQVGPKLQSLGQRFLAVGGFPTDLDPPRLQNGADTRAESFMIVND